MYSLSVHGPGDQDVTQESTWLPVGREYHPSLRGTHAIHLERGSNGLAGVAVLPLPELRCFLMASALQAGLGMAPLIS